MNVLSLGSWVLCSKFPSLFYSEFLFIELNFTPFMLLLFPICNLNYRLKVCYLMLFEPLKSTHFTFINAVMLSLSVCNPEWEASLL